MPVSPNQPAQPALSPFAGSSSDPAQLAASASPSFPSQIPNVSSPGTDPFAASGVPSFFPSSNSLFQELEQQYAAVPGEFSTAQFDTAEKAQEGYITTAASQAAGAAGAEYANRARQAGGSAEGAGLVKAEAEVSGQRNVADMKLQAAQYDIAQREQAANLESQIADNLGKLRDSYLAALSSYKGEQLRSQTQEDVAKLETSTQSQIAAAALAEKHYEYQWDPRVGGALQLQQQAGVHLPGQGGSSPWSYGWPAGTEILASDVLPP